MLQNVNLLSLPVNIESPQGNEMAPKGIDIITPVQCRAARAGLGMSSEVLAERTQVHRVTINKFENGKTRLLPAYATAIKRVLEEAGAEFPDLETVRFPLKKKEGPKPSS